MTRPLLLAACVLAAALPARAQAPCTGGTATLGGVAYACSGVDLLAVVSPQTLGAPANGACPNPYPNICANDVWGWTDPATGHEVALVGLVNGLAFVDVTVPAAPVLLGRLPTQTVNSTWRDVEVYADHAFVVSEATDHGMQVFDLRRLRGLAADPARTFTADAVYSRIGSAHTVAVNPVTGFAYPVGFRLQGSTGLPASCNVRGVHAIDVRTPAAPVFSTCFNDADRDTHPFVAPGYTHDMVCQIYAGPDAAYVGHELCFASNEDVLTIFDATDKTNVRVVSQGSYPGTGYTHQGWFASGQRYFLINDELDEVNSLTPSQRTIVMDLQDLDQPEVAFIYTSGLPVIDHNLYVNGRYAYESNYEAGLRILDLARVGEGVITEAGFFDTYPQGQSANFNGQWANYPFFASGVVVANDVRNGLFVLRPTVTTTAASPGPSDTDHALSEPVPNPTADGAQLTLRVETEQTVTAELLDLTGRRVATVFVGTAVPGSDTLLRVDTAGLAPGVYVVRVTGATVAATRHLVVAR